jgi:3,4-dihydroxy 2-butanone 4-phosphate synthase/GTP cyclohydrolase II
MVPPVTLRIARATVRGAASAVLPARSGHFKIHAMEMEDGSEIVAVVAGEIGDGKDILVRLHSECLTGDVMGSLRCDCRAQLEAALERISEAGRGIVVYLPQEGRGIGLLNKIRAYALQDQGLDTVDANLELGFEVDERSYEAGAEALRFLGVQSVMLLSNNPLKRSGLEDHGIEVRNLVEIRTPATEDNAFYLDTKRRRCGHLL